jgi:AraC-like DNA-binding protein
MSVLQNATVRPPARLRPFVARYSGYRYEGLDPGTHLGLPSRHLTVVISLGEPTNLLRMPDPRQAPGGLDALAGGLHTRPVVIGHSGAMHGVQLDLTPDGARSLLGMPARELCSAVVPLDRLLGVGSDNLIERLSEAASWPARFAILDEVLTRRTGRLVEAPAELRHAWRCLASSDGTLRISDLAGEVGWSRRHLTERFTAEYGIAPKEMARVMRFERSKRLLQEPGRPPLATVAVTCGYYDQAHLAREWNDLIGLPPSAWLAAEHLLFVQDDDAADHGR